MCMYRNGKISSLVIEELENKNGYDEDITILENKDS